MPPKKNFSTEWRKVLRDDANGDAAPPSRKPPTYFVLNAEVASWIFFAVHLASAFYSPIQDCDEVFNYWEPTHYLNYRHGMQTWEYSPEYAIRSWFYVGIHAVPIYIASWLPFISSKSSQFYFLRILFAYVCAKLETGLFTTIARAMNPRVAFFYLVATATSTGFFHAATAYLPSTFAMYTVIYALNAFMDWQGGIRTHHGLFALAVGTIVGWPFVAVLALPFLFEEFALGWISGDAHEMLRRSFIVLMSGLGLLLFVGGVDTFFYRIRTVVSYNIVSYNIFSGASKGPNIYGTEPWHFYTRNLLLNFNLWFPLAVLSLPLLIYHNTMHGKPATRLTHFRSLVFVSPFYIWLLIFTLQPHKEERFLYPIYPCLALNAALTLHILLLLLTPTTSSKSNFLTRLPPTIKLLLPTLLILLTTTLSLLRTTALTTAYTAPLSIYTPLHTPGTNRPGNTICLGKEWYRFPSSYHLPPGTRPKFIRSAFTGLLPGEFSEATSGFGWFPGAWLVPAGMNDRNIEDVAKYVEEDRCTFLVDSWFEGQAVSEREPDRVHDGERWERMQCLPFLDAARTGWVGRLFWVPEAAWVPERFRRRWGEYCLLRRK